MVSRGKLEAAQPAVGEIRTPRGSAASAEPGSRLRCAPRYTRRDSLIPNLNFHCGVAAVSRKKIVTSNGQCGSEGILVVLNNAEPFSVRSITYENFSSIRS